MDFLPQWIVDLSPWGVVVLIIMLLATGRLTRFHTDRVEKDADARIAEAKEANTALLKAKDEAHATARARDDEEITHLRDVNNKAMDALERIADATEEQSKTAEIVKAVMNGLQNAATAKPRDPTGPVQKVTL